MCLTIRDRKIHTAETDFAVYKLLELSRGGVLRSPYFSTKWELGEAKRESCFNSWYHLEGDFLTEKLFINEIPPYVEIVEKGFHAYTTLKMAEFWKVRSPELIVCLMVVPKGSKYILGHNDEIVTNSMRLGWIGVTNETFMASIQN